MKPIFISRQCARLVMALKSRFGALVLVMLAVPATHLGAAPRASDDYSLLAETSNAGGRHSVSASYANDGSVGGIAGMPPSASTNYTAKAGYIGQLHEIVGFVVNAFPASVPEGAGLQLDPAHLLDDATLLAIAPTLVNWNVISGPITMISSDGLATADIVYQNTLATVQGSFGASTASLNLTVLNATTDDYGSYAGDGLGDDWQVQYFGLPPNLAAGPLLDPDGDGQNNYFEWTAGLIPTDASSVFKLDIVGSFQGANLIFGPTVAGRTYTVKYGFDFLDVPNWPTLVGGIVTAYPDQRTVTDTSAFASPRKFYRVEIAK